MSERELTTLRNELAALREQLARQGAAPAEHPTARQRPARRRGRAVLLGGLLVLLLALAPLGALAANFVDLNPGSGHNANINAIADAGITLGCFDTSHYCPNDFVTREQMASFLARTAGLGGNSPVTNAKTLQGHQANGLARVGVGQQAPAPIFTSDSKWKTVSEVTVTVPGPGYVLVNGVAVETLSGATGSLHTQLYDATTGQASSPLDVVVTQGLNLPVSPTHVFAVNAAGVHTFQLQIRATSSSWTVTASDSTITALFVPFGPTGNTP